MNNIPSLHDQFTSISIHFAGVRCFLENLIMPEMLARNCHFAYYRENQTQIRDLQEARIKYFRIIYFK